MAQHLQIGRSENSQRAWVSTLVDTMERVARPEVRAAPCDRSVLAAVRVQLAQPATSYPHYGYSSSFRN